MIASSRSHRSTETGPRRQPVEMRGNFSLMRYANWYGMMLILISVQVFSERIIDILEAQDWDCMSSTMEHKTGIRVLEII